MCIDHTSVLGATQRSRARGPARAKERRCARRNYGAEDAAAGKGAAKAELRARMGLGAADVPLVAVVTRLTHQKGIHLIKHAAWRTLERGAQFVLLGSAPDPKVQARAAAAPSGAARLRRSRLNALARPAHFVRSVGSLAAQWAPA